MPTRRAVLTGALASGALASGALASGALASVPVPALAAPAAGARTLLTDPFLQRPERTSVSVVWFTGFPGDRHAVLTGDGVGDLAGDALARAGGGRGSRGVRVHRARTTQLSRTAEDAASQLPADRRPAAGIAPRPVYRHEAVVRGLPPGRRVPYRVVSLDGDAAAASAVFTLRGALLPGERGTVLLTSDHQAMVNTPGNIEIAARTIGAIDAVFLAGDLVNIPDRASEWFDDQRGSAFFPVLQGRAGRAGTDGVVRRGAPLIQNAPLFPAIGNHEVQGRIAGATGLNQSFNAPVPRAVAEAAAPDGLTGTARAEWIEDNSFSTTTYEEIFSLPGNGRYYAVTVGDVRLITLYCTRIWRDATAQPDPAARTRTSRFQEARTALDDPFAQGYGEFVFEDVGVGSAQYRWLERELGSPERRRARFTVVMLHEGPHGLGDNLEAPFAHPRRVEERDPAGELVGVRYEYPAAENLLLRDLAPLLERAGVDLVHNGHSHLWNRLTGPSGTTYLETSNCGNSYGAFHPLSGRSRPVPPAPWTTANHVAQGDPGGLEPEVPSVAPLRDAAGTPLPFVADDQMVVFTALDTATGEVTSWYADLREPDPQAVVLDRFTLGG